MKIVLVSDSHGKTGALLDVLESHPNADLYLHAGDLETQSVGLETFHIVQGNNDYYSDFPDMLSFASPMGELGLLHSHQFFPFKREAELVRVAKQKGWRIVCYGHTHIKMCKEVDGVWLINPGSLFYNRDASAPCYAILEIQESKLEVEFIELPKAIDEKSKKRKK
ncbi:MAG: metallophosphoesterase family protein [Erysipelotrichaceae bacterium]